MRLRAALDAGRFTKARELFEAAERRRPLDLDGLVNFSATLFATGDIARAREVAQAAVEKGPESPDAWVNLGVALHAQGEVAPAENAYRTAIDLMPSHVDARLNLAIASIEKGDLREGGQLLLSVVSTHPDHAEANYRLARLFYDHGEVHEAKHYALAAIEHAPSDPDALNLAGVILRQTGDPGQAAALLQRAATSEPNSPVAYINLCRVYHDLGQLNRAIEAGERSVELAPTNAEALTNLGSAVRAQGDVVRAIDLFRSAAARCDHPRPASNRLCAEQYRPGVSRGELRRLHDQWANSYATAPAAAALPLDGVLTERPIRVGFLSPDLGVHPVGFFLSGLLKNLDPIRVESFCYSDRTIHDKLTATLGRNSTAWRETAGVPDRQLINQIRRDEVDILFDLAGHTNGNRLQLFAARAAPIQATWLGYVGTTGVPAIDYLIADNVHVADHEEADYVESIARMPNGYLCYEPPKSPDVSSLPALVNGHITFGAFHNPAKISQTTVELWAEVLRDHPSSQILFKYGGYDDSSVSERIVESFRSAGIDSRRFRFCGATSNYDHLSAFGAIDVMLDPTPYSGGLTTCESLWMGVPVITMAGETFAGRHAASHLQNAGYAQFVTHDVATYREAVEAIVSDLDELSALRLAMRDQVAVSPLCDAEQFANDFMRLMRTLVERHKAVSSSGDESTVAERSVAPL